MQNSTANEQIHASPWASFCMSTYKRPQFLQTQVASLLQQTFINFEIVISDNDPEASGEAVITAFNDARIKYQCNGDNIGMVKSFNRSVERAKGQYIIMVTDDDPVATDLLAVFHRVVQDHPGFSLYGGLKRSHTKDDELEMINADHFINEFLDLDKTTDVLWSSCLLKKDALVQIGMLPDYGSPHLVDHAMLALVGSIDGAILINKMYSNIVLHGANFSKSNFYFYYNSCEQFYKLLEAHIKDKPLYEQNKKVIINHLGRWFISSVFNLLNHYRSAANYNETNLLEIKAVAEKILQLPYMQRYRFKYRAKLVILTVKFALGIKK